MRIVVMGLGRLGGSLVPLLAAAGCTAVGWTRGQPVPPDGDVYWITVSDGAVATVAGLVPPRAVALHAAGAHGPALLGDHAERGVLHPLMTFPGAAVALPDLRGVGARIDGTPRARAAAIAVATALGMRPFTLDGDVRLYHAAAALASGHGAALFLDAARVLARAGIEEAEARALLLPLALESLRRAAGGGAAAITGPAARRDAATEARHRAVLEPSEAELYEALARRIRALREGA